MSEQARDDRASGELQFDTAEKQAPPLPTPLASPVAAPARPSANAIQCAGCGQAIDGTYYAVADKVICPTCRERLTQTPSGNKVSRLLKATFMGIGAGLLGAVIWFAIRRLANVELGLIAILVGFLVGKAVRLGSGNLGGRGYQVLAVVITYCCIAANYMPDVIEAVIADARKDRVEAVGEPADEPAAAVAAGAAAAVAGAGQPDEQAPAQARPAATPVEPRRQLGVVGMIIALAVGIVFVFAFSLALPVLGGAENIIGLLIIGFALWEAWKFNARQQLPISGPYQVGAPRAV
jgi:hypothetical protein